MLPIPLNGSPCLVMAYVIHTPSQWLESYIIHTPANVGRCLDSYLFHTLADAWLGQLLRLGGPSAKARLGGGSLDHLMEAKRR